MFSYQDIHGHAHATAGLPWQAARDALATMLRWASARLGQLAAALTAGSAEGPPTDPRFEFHAEAGAPEGALYVDGRLVGWLHGVTRL